MSLAQLEQFEPMKQTPEHAEPQHLELPEMQEKQSKQLLLRANELPLRPLTFTILYLLRKKNPPSGGLF